MKKTNTVKKTAVAALPAKAEEMKEVIVPSTEKKVKATKTKAVKAKPEEGILIEKACILALGKLKALNIDERLQSEIQWCLGSYQSDNNPTGLYQMAERALGIFTVELANKTKGVTPKLIADLEKAVGVN